jgi:hypothetical protein
MENLRQIIKQLTQGLNFVEKQDLMNEIRCMVHEEGGIEHPVSNVQFVHISDVISNDYNPNKVAPTELKLLHLSIKNEGFTQPIVVSFDSEINKYVIIDGFHRYYIMKTCEDICSITKGYLPVVVLEKDKPGRMAATVRHNRARGTHAISGMSNIVFEMLMSGKTDVDICYSLGMEPDELIKVKHKTGYSKLYENVEYSRAWVVNDTKLKPSKKE